MNRKEAIEELKIEYLGDTEAIREAKDIAIEALEAQQELISATNEIYAKGYNAAKREIALSGEYERAYHRGKIDATKWIPVSERLPEELEEVLVCVTHNGKSKMAVSCRRDYNYWDAWGRDIIGEMAWMLLPDPYKGGDSE